MNITSPVWFAFPPEVHSTLLSTGAGPGPLLTAAEEWRALATQYSYAASELAELFATVQSSAWKGPSAERFVAAHQPFLCWLGDASAAATATATGHETAATGYASALDSMPTPAELTMNHAWHAALVTINFFGINTVPIALNEAAYLRMWVQAATAMTVYQAVSEGSLTVTPTTSPAPQIVHSEGRAAPDSGASSFPNPVKAILALLKDLLDFLRKLTNELLPGPLGNLITQALDSLLSFVSSQVFTILMYAVIDPIIYLGPFTPLMSPFFLPGLVGLTGLAGVYVLPKDPEPTIEGAQPDEPGHSNWPAATGGVPTSTIATIPTASPTTTTTASAAPPSPPAPSFDASQGFYAVGGPDGEGFTPTARSNALSSVTADTGASTVTLAGARAQADTKKSVKAQARFRQYRFEFLEDDGRMTMSTATAAEQVTASNLGMESLGFAGTIPKSAAGQVKGLTHLSSDEFTDTPQAPMLPHTWSDDEPR